MSTCGRVGGRSATNQGERIHNQIVFECCVGKRNIVCFPVTGKEKHNAIGMRAIRMSFAQTICNCCHFATQCSIMAFVCPHCDTSLGKIQCSTCHGIVINPRGCTDDGSNCESKTNSKADTDDIVRELRSELAELQSKHAELQNDHGELGHEIKKLACDHMQLVQTLNTLRAEHQDLLAEHKELSDEHDLLSARHDRAHEVLGQQNWVLNRFCEIFRPPDRASDSESGDST